MKKKLHTTKIVAQYLDLSERRVRQLRDEGVLEEKAPGLYDLRSSVRRYINYLRGDEGGKADLNEERAKLTKEKRIAAETENKVRNGELYRKSDIMTGMTTIVMNLRSRLLALPNKLAANIAKLDGDEDKIMDLLQSSLHEIMEEFSNYQVALERPKDDEDTPTLWPQQQRSSPLSSSSCFPSAQAKRYARPYRHPSAARRQRTATTRTIIATS